MSTNNILHNVVELMCKNTFNTNEHNLTNELYKKYKHIKLTEENINDYYKIRHCECISAYYAKDYKNGYEACKELLLINIDTDTHNIIFNLQFYIQEIENDKNQEEREQLLEYLYIFKNKISSLNKEFSNLIWNYIKDYTLKYNKKLYDIENKCHKSESAKSSNKILVYTGFADPNWNYTTAINGALGGSEKAVAFMTKELSKKYEVYISGDVIDEKIDNITYINRHRLHHLLETTEFHTILISRYLSFFLLYPNFKCYKLLVAGHDVMLLNNIINHPVSASDILYKYSNMIDNIIVLTEWHKQYMHSTYYPYFDINKFVLINNGINTHNISHDIEYSSKKIKNSFIYTSCSNRGLERITDIWPEIVEKMPDATLNIASYERFPIREEDYKIGEVMKKYDNIKHLGKLNEKQLHELRVKSEFWLYPNIWTETSCITSLEMLLSEIVCIYYPLAGLTNTLGDYGIQTKKGEELQTILDLTSEKKQEMVKRGKEYALSCSWANRAKIWENLIFGDVNTKKIAIFNSFPFHYEVFGFILDYAKKMNYHVDMYIPSNSSELGWLEFYKSTFNNFTIFEYTQFNKNNNYELIFVTTDDDPQFKQEWVNNKVICLNHYYKTRNHIFNNYINIAKFRENTLDYIYPCYKLYNSPDKIIDSNYINIALVGSSYLNIDIINRLSSKNKNIKLHIFTRKIVNHLELENIDKRFEVSIINNIDTSNMIEYLKNIEYLLLTNSKNNDHNIAKSSSGATQFALSCLCKPIICESANIHLNLKNAITFDIDLDIPINLDNFIDFNMLEIERNMYINNRNYLLNNIIYHNMYCKNNKNKINIIPKRIIQSWISKDISDNLNKFINTWKVINNDYQYILYDDNESKKFIEDHFTDIVVKTYKKLIPGAFKCDLFRLCELYINGGFYCDIDSLCISKIDNIMCDNLIFAVPIDLNSTKSEGEHNIANSFMLSIPYNPILLEAIHRAVKNIETNNIYGSLLDIVSCGVLGRSINTILQRDEIDSFIGKEGKYILDEKYVITLLKFEKGNEYIKNINGEILFQNKNGNPEIIQAYNEECKKYNHKTWVGTPNIIDYSI